MKEHALENPKELMERAKSGDRNAFGALYTLYFTPVYRYLYFRVGTQEEAEDLTQTVFLKVFRSLERFNDRGTSPLAYFYTIARNTLIDHWRKKRAVILDEPEDLVAKADAQQARGESSTAHDATSATLTVEKALTFLSDEQQEVIIQRFLNDAPTREIAKLLGKSEDAVRQIQCRALKILRAHMHPHNHDNTI